MRVRTTISLNKDVDRMARDIMRAMGHDQLSEFLAQLIREEYQERQGQFVVKTTAKHVVKEARERRGHPA